MAELRVTVVYCFGSNTLARDVELPQGASLRDAVVASGLLQLRPELDAQALDLGVYNRPKAADEPLRDGDRIEIYRPLTIDPKEARRVRAEIRKRRKEKGT